MKRLFDHILKPNSEILMLYGLFSLTFLTFYVWWFSFGWEFVFSVTHYVFGLFIVLILGFVIANKLDKNKGFKIKRYLLISAVQLILIWLIANPIRTWQIESSLEKANLIIEPLNSYKLKYNSLPITLEELGQKLNLEIPTRTNIGTRYLYQIDKEQEYSLSFQSYYGHTAYYNTEHEDWIITD